MANHRTVPKITWTSRDTAVYHFSEEELEYLERLGEERHESNRERGIEDQQIDDTQSAREIDFRSAKSEWAVAKLLGLLPNDQTYFDEECKQGDLRLPGGDHLEVKCPKSRKYKFFIRGTNVKRFTADVGVLVFPITGSEDLEIVGYTVRRIFLEKAFVIRTEDPFLALGNEHLLNIRRLVELVEERR
jgi:hypothetical protein